jgi:hypothetical protein
MKTLIMIMWLSGFFTGIIPGFLFTLYLIQDTGAQCMFMYENPEDQIECVLLLNND